MKITLLHWISTEQEPISMAYSSSRTGLVELGLQEERV